MHNIVWTDCKRRLNPPLHLLREVMVQSLRDEPRYNRTVKTEYQVLLFLIIFSFILTCSIIF